MKKVLPILLLLVSPVWAQTKPATVKPSARPAAPVVDDCAPIGRTEKGELVYSLKCDNLPVPSSAAASTAPRVEAPAAAPAAEPEVRRSGVFGWSYDRR
ncbi:hypothetical protein [Bradyrhizobium sp. CER78]|uniref:hypothetical protein n=1 Tax=Bradyrhizobium sp. CER78 TaxID=3039162 RepID=UPI00244D0A98|nr:hypothetical protein [Bradyrhizobium sp. CER78]MDH2384104.1 hypothetical protein [Bradyrhizobium sp. CER78]